MAKYRKKPVVINAAQFLGTTESVIEISGLSDKEFTVDYRVDPPVLKIDTLEGLMTATVGDWIIRGVHGEIYPCKPEIFEATHEEVT